MGRVGDEGVGERHLGAPCLPGLGHNDGIGHRAVEVAVGLGRRGEARWRVLTGEDLTEPAAFHVGKMADEAEQREGGGPDGAPGQLRVQTGALQFQRRALGPEEPDKHASFFARRGSTETGSSSGPTNMAALLCGLVVLMLSLLQGSPVTVVTAMCGWRGLGALRKLQAVTAGVAGRRRAARSGGARHPSPHLRRADRRGRRRGGRDRRGTDRPVGVHRPSDQQSEPGQLSRRHRRLLRDTGSVRL